MHPDLARSFSQCRELLAFLLCFAPITFIGPVVYLLVDSILAPSATFSRKSLCILLPGLTGLVFSLTAMQHSDTEMIAMVQSYCVVALYPSNPT